MRHVVVAASLCAAVALARAQSPREVPVPRSQTIIGRVVAADTGDPVRNARVTVGSTVVLADKDGRFSIAVAPNQFTLTAAKPGFAPRSVTSVADSKMLKVALDRGAAITGRVVDTLGDRSSGHASWPLVGIDIALSKTRTARIAGRIIDAAGESSTGGTVSLKPSVRSTATTSVPMGARIGTDGSFEFPNIPTGP